MSSRCGAEHKTDTEEPEGYPKLARGVWMSTNCLIFRKYRYLYIRTLHHLQAKLQLLEAHLQRLDHEDASDNPHLLRKVSREDHESGARDELMAKIATALKEYGTYHISELSDLEPLGQWRLIKLSGELQHVFHRFTNMPRPPKSNIMVLSDWMDTDRPVADEEEFMYDHSDLVHVGGTDDAALSRALIGGWNKLYSRGADSFSQVSVSRHPRRDLYVQELTTDSPWVTVAMCPSGKTNLLLHLAKCESSMWRKHRELTNVNKGQQKPQLHTSLQPVSEHFRVHHPHYNTGGAAHGASLPAVPLDAERESRRRHDGQDHGHADGVYDAAGCGDEAVHHGEAPRDICVFCRVCLLSRAGLQMGHESGMAADIDADTWVFLWCSWARHAAVTEVTPPEVK